ncbi:MAG: response regulator [bacterium]
MANNIVLIVDDEPIAHQTLEALLTPEDYELVFASSGPEALEKAARILPDVILLDVMMPGMDGYETCRRLRANPATSSVPVIMITALNDRKSLITGIESGADDFITKPIDNAELRARMRTITTLNRYRLMLTEQSRFEWMLERSQDGYVLISKTGEIKYANASARSYLSLPQESPLPAGMSFLALTRKQYSLEPADLWITWPEPAPEGTTRYMLRPETESEHIFYLRADCHKLTAGKKTEYLIHLRDLTTQLTSERDMSVFHYFISHKLNTPLNHLIGSLQLLADNPDSMTRDEIADFWGMALSGAKALEANIKDIFEYVSASDSAWSRDAVLPAQALRHVVDAVSAMLELGNVNFIITKTAENTNLMMNRRAMEIIIGKLLENSKKFHPNHDPNIIITADVMPGGLFRLRVLDEGANISPDQLARLWTPYYQAGKSHYGETQGMGLGLATVGSIVWAVRGTCSIGNRTDGPGVVVEIYLPLKAGLE